MITGTRYRLTLEINRHLALARDIERAQTEISTGKRIQAPSDDPVGAARVSDIARTQANEAVWMRNLQWATSLSDRADTVLAAAGTAVDRASELMLAAANGTLSDANRATIALELRSIADELTVLKEARDSRGDALFPVGDPIRIPVGDGIALPMVGSRSQVFENVATASGPKDLAAIVRAAADAIEEADGTVRSARVNECLGDISSAAGHISAMRGEQGARGNRIDALIERLSQSEVQLEEERSAVESADVMKLVAQLQARQLTLQAAQAVFTRVNQNTLFDLLR